MTEVDEKNQSTNEDEKIHEMTVGEIDPAIIVVREKKFVYTREQLFEIGKNAASKVRPAFLDPAEVPNSMLDPEKWNLERRKSDTPTENGAKSSDGPENRRRSGDPRERIRKENDGIVLSPQRRSFNTGCFVPANREPINNNTRPGGRPHSPLGGKGDLDRHIGGREIPTGGRRVGSGRIMRVNCDMDKGDGGDGDYYNSRGGPLGGPMRGLERNIDGRDDKRGEDKYGERRTFGRDFDNRDIKDNGRRNMRFNNDRDRRRYSENREEIEPEWFSSGPISQNDTIELRGFDETEKPNKKVAPSRMKRAKEWARKKTESQSSVTEEKEEEARGEGNERSSPDTNQNQAKNPTNNEEKASSNEANTKPKHHNDHSIHFEDILKCDTIPGIFANGVDGGGDNTTSRFSRWFRTSPQDKGPGSSRRSSMQEENSIIKDLLKDINEQSSIPISIQPPGDSDSYFAPISPAGSSTAGSNKGQPGQPVNIMDMFQRGKQQPNNRDFGHMAGKPGSGKILSLDELEAKIRPDTGLPQQQQSKVQKPDEGMTEAFKRLLAQAGGQSASQNGPMHKPQAMSLMEMLNHSQQQDEARMAAAINQQHPLIGGNVAAVAQAAAAMQHHNDLTIKLQQAQIQKQQMEMLNKLINAPPQMRGASPLIGMDVQQSRELLNRPEAQAILQGLKRGEITTQNLYQQLANPALQPRHRDMLLTIIKLHNAGSVLQQAGNTLHAAASATAANLLPGATNLLNNNLLATGNSLLSAASGNNLLSVGNSNSLLMTSGGGNSLLTQSAAGSNPASGGASYGPSPRVLSPVPPQHALYQQQLHQQQQLRVSPLPPNAMHQRIPSPRELQVHTQNILQRALIKKKLEEQTENYRKKQELQRGASPNPSTSGANSTPKSVSSPTPLAFTPTSVLRKMTADKDEGKENKADYAAKLMGRPVTGMRPQAQPVVPSPNWNQQFSNAIPKQVGRPIVKNNYQPPQTADQFFAQVQQQQNQQQQQRLFAVHQQQQQMLAQQQRKPMMGQNMAAMNQQQFGQQPQISVSGVQNQYGNSAPHYQNSGNSYSQQPTLQQLRAQHQHRPANQNQAQPSSAGPQATVGQSPQAQRDSATNQQPAGNNGNNVASGGWQQNNSEPQQTTNQLSRWFSPDLLERARGGELPSTANLARHAMSLEEIERQAAPPVHN